MGVSNGGGSLTMRPGNNYSNPVRPMNKKSRECEIKMSKAPEKSE